MKKKVGMLSFHDSYNYGAILQCFALQLIIKKMGYDAEFINFQREKCKDYKKNEETFIAKIKKIISKFRNKIINLLYLKNDKIKIKKFKLFNKKFINISNREFNSINDIYNYKFNYDTYITGSDQVWNPNRNYLQVYGLGFAPNNSNTISYAASMGVSNIPNGKKEFVYECLHNIKHLSCRELDGANELQKLLNRKVTNVLDPTFLLDKKEWEKYVLNNPKHEKYILCYFVGNVKYPSNKINKFAKDNSCKIYIIHGSNKDIFYKGKIINGCGPQDFISLFSNAFYVFTDSFHGTAFSINFNKPFYTFYKDNNNINSTISRIKNLLELLKLSDRLVSDSSDKKLFANEIDYAESMIILSKQREKSLKYLEKSLMG